MCKWYKCVACDFELQVCGSTHLCALCECVYVCTYVHACESGYWLGDILFRVITIY